LKATIRGKIKCRNDKNIDGCLKTLNRFKIAYAKEGSDIAVDGSISVTPWFDQEGFHQMMKNKIRPFGECSLKISTIY